VIARYGHRWFKIKLSGDIEADLDRLARIASVLDRSPGYGVTIDGNEQFAGVAPLAELLDRLERNPALGGLRRAIAYIEQPFSRAITLDTPLGAVGARVPFLIDESDDSDAAFSRATAMGYRGVSSKTCKGVYRSLLKAVRIRSGGARGLFLSGEDLTCQAGLSVQQDLALVSLLGLGHVERNGHHYVDGMQGASGQEMDGFATAHPDLYRRDATGLHLDIRAGQIALRSLGGVGYASGAVPDFCTMRPLDEALSSRPSEAAAQ
jgi:hypothetical protein